MSDIILVNNQNQDEVLPGVSKLVTRGPSGDVEFSLGGGTQTPDSMVVYHEASLKINGSKNYKIYTKSPAEGLLTYDVPANATVLECHPDGNLNCTVMNSETGNVTSEKSITEYKFSSVTSDAGNTRIQSPFSIEWDGGTRFHVRTINAKLKLNMMYHGASIVEDGGKYVLSGQNSAQFYNSLYSGEQYSYLNTLDFGKDTSTSVSIAILQNLTSLEKIVFSEAGCSDDPEGVPIAYALAGCVNLSVLDYSRVTTVQPCPGTIAYEASQFVNGVTVLVPSALYDEWITTKRWKEITSTIVAV